MNIKDVRNSITKHANKKFGTRKIESITDIAIHHSGTIVGDSASFARFHVQNNGWAGVGYHYVILLDGTIEYCGDINTVRANVGGNNSYLIGICLVGDYSKGYPPKAQLEATFELINKLMKDIPSIKRVRGHREFPNQTSSCPGFDINKFRSDYEEYKKKGVEKPVSNNPEQWKVDNLKYLVDNKMISDYDGWLKKIDDNMPAWAVFSILANMHKVLKGESEKK